VAEAGALDRPSSTPDAGPGDTAPLAPITDGLTQLLVSRAIGLAYYHSCLILPTHEVRCFGDVANPQDPRLHPPAGLRAEQIHASHNGFCVTRAAAAPAALAPGVRAVPAPVTTKSLTCWGLNATFFPPANLAMDPIQVGIGYEHGCVLNADHSVVCWGQPGTNNQPPAGLRAKSIAVAAFFNCAVTEDDGVVCWGINPPAPPAGLKAKLVAVAYHGNLHLVDAAMSNGHACAIKLDDTVTCWGAEMGGNLTVPADLGPVRDVAVATFDSCAVRLDGEPVCWGTAVYDMMDPTRYHPKPPGLRLKGLRAQLGTYCGVQLDDTIVCWGDEQHQHIDFPAGGLRLYVP
jgi:hypothetical protein